jgi:hypothetical protein
MVIIRTNPALTKTGIIRELKNGNINKITLTLISIRKNGSGFRVQGLKSDEYRISNIEPQNYEGVTSTFDIPCSIFCGSK